MDGLLDEAAPDVAHLLQVHSIGHAEADEEREVGLNGGDGGEDVVAAGVGERGGDEVLI
ncbi:hypothetical protein BH20VER1_BH20VER1_04860 [soil metagenome]